MGALLEEKNVSLQRWPARVIERGPHNIAYPFCSKFWAMRFLPYLILKVRQ